MLSEDEYIKRVFAIATEMALESKWARHIWGVDGRYIRFKNGKNVDADRLKQTYPYLLQIDLTPKSANPIIMAATKSQPCVNVPLREIVRRLREVA